jgi:uncharacterized lipoprotein YmbA
VIIAVGRVTVAPYLDQPGIVVATTGHRMQIANDHRWAEPLDVAVRRNLELGIAAASGLSVVGAPMAREQRLIVDVTIQQLHGTIDGQVGLVAEWQWLDGGSAALISHHQSRDHTEVEKDGYDALVDAHAMLLERLAGSVAATLPPSSEP